MLRVLLCRLDQLIKYEDRKASMWLLRLDDAIILQSNTLGLEFNQYSVKHSAEEKHKG